MSAVEVRQVPAEEWRTWRKVRLRALRDAPDAFGSTYERELAFDDEQWRSRLNPPAIIAFDGDHPVGLGAGFEDQEGWLHVVAMWVDPACRGSRVGEQILDRVVDWARENELRVHLDVAESNPSARRLYERYGFVDTGHVEPLREGSPILMARMALPRRPG